MDAAGGPRMLEMLGSVRAVARRLTLDRQLDFWMRELAPPPRARIVSAQTETHDLSTLALEPIGGAWPGHRAGQFVTIGVEIDGVRFQRCYSLSSAPDKAPTIMVKRVGKVSTWLHANVGATVELGRPQGQFVVPPTARKLLLVTGGSGISPAMSILRGRRLGDAELVFVHAARSQKDVPFVDELRTAGAILFLDDVIGRLDRERLRATVPDLHERTTMLCGPAAMMDALIPEWEGMPEWLVLERFVRARPTGEIRKVAETSLTLLESLELAGERPASGCRMGICNTCVCRKQSGIVENVLTGARSHAGEEDIHLCVSRAITDVEICR